MEIEVDQDFFNNLDHSLLQQPVNTGIKNIHQILSCIQNGNSEVHNIIINECSIIYECKVCRNLFRALPNLIAHKRFYCKESVAQFYKRATDNSPPHETILIVEPEDAPETEFIDEQDKTPEETENSDSESQAIKFEPSPIYQSPNKDPNFQITVSSSETGDTFRDASGEDVVDDSFQTVIQLQKIEGNPNAVYMSVSLPEDPVTSELNSSEDKESQASQGHTEESNMSSEAPSTLSRRKQLMRMSSCCVKTLTCLRCKTSYTTIKTLYSHMKSIHAKTRTYYPCPICKTPFVKMWGVTRHMSSVHHKSKEQINKYRDIIKKRAFAKKVIENSSRRKQVSPKHVEPQVGTHGGAAQNKDYICAKCGRVFDRGSSKVNHQKFCTYAGNSSGESSQTAEAKLGIKQEKPDDDGSKKDEKRGKVVTTHKCFKCGRTFSLKTAQVSHTKFCKGKPFVGQVTATRSEKIVRVEPMPVDNISTRPKRIITKKENADFVSSQTLKWRSANKVESVDNIKEQQKDKHTQACGSPSKDNPMQNIQELKDLNYVEGKVLAMINMEKLICLKCQKKFSSFSNAKRHVATYHFGWMRFKCKYCSYKSYNKSDCLNHVEKTHDGAGDTPTAGSIAGKESSKEAKSKTMSKINLDVKVNAENRSPIKDKSPVPCVSVKKLDLHGLTGSIKIGSGIALPGGPNTARKSFPSTGKRKLQFPHNVPSSVKRPEPSPAQRFEPSPVKRAKPIILKSSPKKTTPSVAPIITNKPVLQSLLESVGIVTEHVQEKPVKEVLQITMESETKKDEIATSLAEESNAGMVFDSVGGNVEERETVQSPSSTSQEGKQRYLTDKCFSVDSGEISFQSLRESASELFTLDTAEEEIRSPTPPANIKKPYWRNTTTSPFITKLVKTPSAAPVVETKDSEKSKLSETSYSSSNTAKEKGSAPVHAMSEAETKKPDDNQVIVSGEPAQIVKYLVPPAPNSTPKKFVVKASATKCVVKPPKCALTSPPAAIQESPSTSGDHAYMTTAQPTVVLLNALGPQNSRTFTFSLVKQKTKQAAMPASFPKKCIPVVKNSASSEASNRQKSVKPSATDIETEAAVQSVVEEQI